MFTRKITDKLIQAVGSFYTTAVVGPRQSGKTTLLRSIFPEYHYLNLEEPDTRAKVAADPRGFFADKNKKWILDEAQEYPELFSFLLGIIDNNKIKGQFILSGSKNFLLLENITQSLAGRIAILELLPLCYSELISVPSFVDQSVWEIIYQGGYPGPLYEKTDIQLWYRSYVTTYLQRDIRQIINVKNLNQFHLFLKLCAGRHGQVLNLSQLGSDCGISQPTAHEWLSILEASYIIFRLPPYYKNLSKRLVKSPKLFFIDPGLVCHLLSIESAEHLQLHASRGAIFEGFIISEIIKEYYARGKGPSIYFCKSYKDTEIDIVLDQGRKNVAIEVKSSATFSKSFLQQLKSWQKTDDFTNTDFAIVYAGDDSFTASNSQVLAWRDLIKWIFAIDNIVDTSLI